MTNWRAGRRPFSVEAVATATDIEKENKILRIARKLWSATAGALGPRGKWPPDSPFNYAT